MFGLTLVAVKFEHLTIIERFNLSRCSGMRSVPPRGSGWV